LWGGWPFFERFWSSLVRRSPNMFTLIGLGTGAAYLYSAAGTVFPRAFPASFRDSHGGVAGFFGEGAGVLSPVLVWPKARTARAPQDRERDSRTARVSPANRAPALSGDRERCPARTSAARRFAACAARRASARRRQNPRGRERVG